MKSQRVNLIVGILMVLVAVPLFSLIGCTSSTPASSQSGPMYPLEINLLDKAGQFTLDSQGKLKSKVQLSSADGRISILLYAGTKFLDKDNQPLQSFTLTVDSQPPLLPDDTDIVQAVYDLTPNGAQFTPAFQLTIAYSPDELPKGNDEGALYFASYQNSQWDTIRYKRIDTDRHTITTTISHSGKFAVLLPLQEQTDTTPIPTSTAPPNPNAVKVVVAGYLNHGPMQATVRAIKDVLTEYGDKVAVTWVDLGTEDGAAYFKQNGLTAHMNVIINGKYQYQINEKTVTFQWFEGQQWTKVDLDAVIASLVGKQ